MSRVGFILLTVTNCPLSEKLKENDYDHIADDPSVPVSMEVERVDLVLEGEAGRSSGEVNTTSVKTILTQDEPQTVTSFTKNKKNPCLGLPL